MHRKYFGTDGIRGRVGNWPMTAEFAVRLGAAIGRVLLRSRAPAKVLIGKDTRVSGYMLESALEAGLVSAGADVVLLGPLPTPGVAYLTRTQGAAAGIVVSASHNPFDDNGIKLFSARGEKLPDQAELEIEAALESPFESVSSEQLGKATRLHDAAGRYIEFVKSTVADQLAGLRGLPVVIDTAHGAGYQVAPNALRELGLAVTAMANQPDGFNINRECGATHTAGLEAETVRLGAALGIALDGDADRLMLVTSSGRVVDGDDVLYLLASDAQARGLLQGPVVGTLMTNLAIEQQLRAQDIKFLRAQVGDRYVHELLVQAGGTLGGEASGHLLMLDKASTGDGLMTALQVLALIARTGKSLDQLVVDIPRYPQRTINLRVSNAKQLMTDARVADAKARVERELGDEGRVVLRASGTEPVIRVTIEARTLEQVSHFGEQLANAVRALQ
jgi:phosphoglucosamine mutase